jgi:transcriptional regulator with GAF, ATPase, and Fis domain
MNVYQKAVRDFGRTWWSATLAKHGNVSAAARALDMNRTGIQYTLRSLGLKSPRAAHRGNWGDL